MLGEEEAAALLYLHLRMQLLYCCIVELLVEEEAALLYYYHLRMQFLFCTVLELLVGEEAVAHLKGLGSVSFNLKLKSLE